MGVRALQAIARSFMIPQSRTERSKDTAQSIERVLLCDDDRDALCVGGGSFPLVQKVILNTTKMPPLSVAAFGYAFGTAAISLVIPVCRREPQHWHMTPQATWALAFTIFVTTAFNYAAIAWCNHRASPAFLTAFNPLALVFTALLATLFLNEGIPSPLEVLGGVIVCGGLVSLSVARTMSSGSPSRASVSSPAPQDWQLE